VSRTPRLLLEQLDAHHDVSTFNSGNEVLDGWLRRHALVAQRMDSARTFVATRSKSVAAGEVAAARLIVVDAADKDAAAFYQQYGFVQAPENPLRFYRRMKDVRASLDSSVEL
jgi:hypothetical protein